VDKETVEPQMMGYVSLARTICVLSLGVFAVIYVAGFFGLLDGDGEPGRPIAIQVLGAAGLLSAFLGLFSGLVWQLGLWASARRR